VEIQVLRVGPEEVTPLRELYRKQMNCQIVHDSFPRRGLSDPYLILVGGRAAGYGTVANRHPKGAVDEFYTLPAYRASALPMFQQLLAESKATKIRAQTNDRLMLLMLYDCAKSITSETILFEDAFSSQLSCPSGLLRKTAEATELPVFEHHSEPVGDWMIESEGTIVATGGALFHYNPPYGDIYMEVSEPYRRRGFGSYLVQELKRICYEMGKVPAARCSVTNTASRKTLEKAGLLPCARVLMGRVK
jgi:GNAT superfamily N-acetyltransferase